MEPIERRWLQHYPPDVPAEIDANRYVSLVQLLEEAFKRFGSRNAYVAMGQALTYARLDELSLQFAAWLQSKGLQKGDRVALMMPNVLQYPVALAGVLRAGMVVVNVNPLYTARELEHQLKDSGATAIVILENFAATLQQCLARTAVRHVVVAAMGDLLGAKGALVNFVVRNVKKMVPAFSVPNAIRFNATLRAGAARSLSVPSLSHEDLAFLQYTGGTTGVSKGAMLTHHNVIANVLQSQAWQKPGLDNPAKGPPPEQSIIVCALPLYHIFSLTVCCLLGAYTGGCNVLIVNPRDLASLVKDLKPFKITMFPAVNTLFNGLANYPPFAQLYFSQLRISNGGGMAVQRAVAERWLKITGCPICEGYGLSETSPSATCNPTDATEYSGTIGLPLPSTEIAILDDAGNPVPLGQAGEIAIRGPQVMAGYWQRPDETAKVMTADGFFKSGDIGIMDERGATRIIDRKKDMILVSGFNVYPNEIEEVVSGHPGVAECAAIGVPDERTGETVKIFVVRKDPSLTEQQLLEFCASQLTGYKRPRQVQFRDDLPKSNVGKILRRELRDRAPVPAQKVAA